MTENKRFTVDKDGRTILDNIDDTYCECVDSHEAKEYCGKLNELEYKIIILEKENKELKSKFKSEEVDLDYVLCLLKRTIGELKYFIKDYEEDEIDITVHNLIRDVDLFLGDKQDIFSGYISYIIDCKEYLEKENEELKHDLKLLQDSLWTTEVIRNLEKENEHLKQQLFYDGDDVCNICKHEYLTPSGDYFISNCRKGHEECSKEDLRYCKDFEVKELRE